MIETADRQGGAGAGLRDRVREATDASTHKAQASGVVIDPIGTPGNPSDRVVTVANLITACRLMLTLAFLVLFVGRGHRQVAVACYAVAALTDFLDGQVARRTHTVSWLGKVMDPIMDRVLLFTGVLGLVITAELPAWVAAFVCGRDAYLGIGALYLQRFRRRPVDVTYVGKAATALLMFGFCDLLLGAPVVAGLSITHAPWLPGLNGTPTPIGMLFVYAGVVCSVAAAAVYTCEGVSIRRASLQEADDGAR